METQDIVDQPTMVGYKAFGPGFVCLGFKYEPGGLYEHKGEMELCKAGFHFCKYPVDVLQYYPQDSNFARVSAYAITFFGPLFQFFFEIIHQSFLTRKYAGMGQ
jgi:hypothetical protein